MSPGVARLPDLSVDAAIARAEADGTQVLVLDTAGLATKAAVIGAAGRVLGAGDDFGLNLDALYDALRDLDPGVVLVWSGWGDVAAGDQAAFEGICEVVEARAEEAAFGVWLIGPGPTDA